MLKENNRLLYIDSIKGIGIIMVILGHIWTQINPILTWIYSFHIPLFFIISGILINYTKIKDRIINEIIKSKLKSLIIPYIFFELLCVLAYGLKYKFNYSIMQWNISEELLLNPLNGPLWFLINLFFVEISFISLLKISNNKIIKLLIIEMLLCMITFLFYKTIIFSMICRYFIGICFITIGYVSYPLIKKYDLSFLIIISFFIFNVILSNFNGKVDLYKLIFNNFILYIICSILGSYSFIFLMKKINLKLNIFKFLGQNTLTFLGLHIMLINPIASVLNMNQNEYIQGVIILLVICIILIPIAMFFNKYLPFLVGKKYVRKSL